MSFEYDIPKCRYIRTNGAHCKSVALKGGKFCYHHQRDHERVENFQQARGLKSTDYMNGYLQLQATLNPEIMQSLDMPALDDAAAIQVAITNILRAVMYDHISDRKAGLALYGLQLAAMNLARLRLTVPLGEEVAATDPQPIHPFWIGAGYDKHLLQRGKAIARQMENDKKPPNKEHANAIVCK